MGVSWWVSGFLGASDGAWAGWFHQHQHHPLTANISVWSDARVRKTLVRWACESPRKKKKSTEKKQYCIRNTRYVPKKIINNSKWKKKQQCTSTTTPSANKNPVITTTCCIFYCCKHSRSTFFRNSGSSWNFWELAIGERRQLKVEDEKENLPFVDVVAIVAEAYGTVCQLYWRLWNATLAT